MLFICTANISRSPYAERRAVQLAPGDADLRFSSAGVPGLQGQGMDPAMAAEIAARGGSGDGHESRSVTEEILDEAHLVITMEFAHRLRIFDRWPHHVDKIFGLRQLADGLERVPQRDGGLAVLDGVRHTVAADGMSWDLDDPYRRGRAVARRCAAEVDRCLSVIVPALASRPTTGG